MEIQSKKRKIALAIIFALNTPIIFLFSDLKNKNRRSNQLLYKLTLAH